MKSIKSRTKAAWFAAMLGVAFVAGFEAQANPAPSTFSSAAAPVGGNGQYWFQHARDGANLPVEVCRTVGKSRFCSRLVPTSNLTRKANKNCKWTASGTSWGTKTCL